MQLRLCCENNVNCEYLKRDLAIDCPYTPHLTNVSRIMMREMRYRSHKVVLLLICNQWFYSDGPYTFQDVNDD